MKHVVSGFFALVLILFAGVVVWSNRTALTVTHLAFAGGSLALGALLALGTDAKDALSTLAGVVPALRKPKDGAP